MSDLTPRQAATVEAIRSFTQRHGYAPTTREIGRLVGVRSTNAVLEMVDASAATSSPGEPVRPTARR